MLTTYRLRLSLLSFAHHLRPALTAEPSEISPPPATCPPKPLHFPRLSVAFQTVAHRETSHDALGGGKRGVVSRFAFCENPADQGEKTILDQFI